MSTIPAKQIERNRIIPAVEITYVPPPANHTYDVEEVYRFALGGGT
jgi:hypothetical protein